MKKAVLLAGLALLSACASREGEPGAAILQPISFRSLPGWDQDDVAQALPAFIKSCGALEKRKADATFVVPQAGTAADWHKACAQARQTKPEEARSFFESAFTPYSVEANQTGLFTGYYEASLQGSRTKKGPYRTPLWSRPKDMIVADLGIFKKSLKGQRIAGKVKEQKLIPYDNRAQIAKGSLKGRAHPLVWVKDPIDAFFLEIQGSGRISLPNGQAMHVGYAAQNGHEYVPIGRVLAQRGEIEKPVTMEKIRAWLAAHPKDAQKIMNENPSYVFFRETQGDGPVGAQGVALTPMRSLAVDPSYLPLGAPVWLESEKHQRLVIAQDTGGAIKGAVRGDLFWGYGATAESGAGEMQERGRYYLLLPRRAE